MPIGMTLMAVLVFAVMSGRATSVSFILAAVLVYRVASSPFGMGGAGFLVLFGSTLAERKRAREWIVTSQVPGQVRRGMLGPRDGMDPSLPGSTTTRRRASRLHFFGAINRCLPGAFPAKEMDMPCGGQNDDA